MLCSLEFRCFALELGHPAAESTVAFACSVQRAPFGLLIIHSLAYFFWIETVFSLNNPVKTVFLANSTKFQRAKRREKSNLDPVRISDSVGRTGSCYLPMQVRIKCKLATRHYQVFLPIHSYLGIIRS